MESSLRPCLAVLAILLVSSSLLPQANSKVLRQYKPSAQRQFFKNGNGAAVSVDPLNLEVNKAHHQHHAKHGDGDKLGSKEGDKIERLPGQKPVNFAQYGGYIPIDDNAGRAYYYYFVESENRPESAPLLLWLNGGPGCSSLAYGAMSELGPFRVHSDGKTLSRNNFAWNKAANVLFLESPAGVGFSYSNTTSDYKTNGDNKTAVDNLVFVLNWLKRFPEYRKRDFFISGESYAGHYVPQLAHNIVQHNKNAHKKDQINLKGVIIGNAVINDESDSKGMYDYFWSHALISDQVRNTIFDTCDFSPSASATTPSAECEAAAEEADVCTDDLDIYNIYAPRCHDKNLTSTPRPAKDEIDPCSDTYTIAYFNSPDVQKALHANVTNLTHDWQPCSDIIKKWSDSPTTIVPLLREFIANDIRVWVFSGDTDGRVPVTSTRYSLATMNLNVKTKWHPWYIKSEVGGYTEEYEGLTFVTVRGSGHQVPSYQPLRALSMIMHFLSGTPLPGVSRRKTNN